MKILLFLIFHSILVLSILGLLFLTRKANLKINTSTNIKSKTKPSYHSLDYQASITTPILKNSRNNPPEAGSEL